MLFRDSFKRLIKTVPLLSLLSLTGCLQMQTPYYDPSYSVYGILEGKNLSPVTLGEIKLSDDSLNEISLRGNPLVSSADDSFASYLSYALADEFRKAGLLEENSPLVISMIITQNDMTVGSSQGTGIISGTVSVTHQPSGEVMFSDAVTGEYRWDSAFFGGTAITRARENYPYVVKSFIRALFQSEAFTSALTLEQ